MLHLWYQIAALLWYRFFNMFTTIISNPARAALLTTYKPDSYSQSMPLAQSVIINALMTCLGVDEKNAALHRAASNFKSYNYEKRITSSQSSFHLQSRFPYSHRPPAVRQG